MLVYVHDGNNVYGSWMYVFDFVYLWRMFSWFISIIIIIIIIIIVSQFFYAIEYNHTNAILLIFPSCSWHQVQSKLDVFT
jgi:hypothetical protein